MINPKMEPCAEESIRSARSTKPCPTRDKPWVLAAAVLGSTMAFVDESVVNVALPRIETDLGTTLSSMQWVINAYTLCMSALLLAGGATADQIGRRPTFLTGITVFALASIACGFAPGIGVLIGARAAQGVGAAFLIPCSLAIIGAAFDEKERGAAIGIWSGATAIAAGAGPLLGGWLVDHASWRVIFLINPLIAVATVWIAWRHVPDSRDPNAPAGIDWRGALLVFCGLGSVVYGLIAASNLGWGNPSVDASLAAGVLLLLAFIWAERRSRAPMMPPGLFRSRSFSGVNLLTLLLYGALGGAFFFLPFLLIQAHEFSATAAGSVYLPFTVVLAGLSRWSGGLADRFGARWPLIVGPAVVAVGFVTLGLVSADDRLWIYLMPMAVLGFGMAITVAPLTTTVMNSVEQHQTGVASGINNAVAAVASLLMIAVLGTAAIDHFDRSLDRNLESTDASAQVRLAVNHARGSLVSPPPRPGFSRDDHQQLHAIVAASFADTSRLVMFVSAALALASAGSAALTIRSDKQPVARRSQSPALDRG